MNAMEAFERQIAELVSTDPYAFPKLLSDGICGKVQGELQTQLVKKSVDNAKEVFGATLSILCNARVDPAQASRHLAELDFHQLSEAWASSERYKRDALNAQIRSLSDLVPAQKITGIEILDGDSHNGGFAPLAVTVNGTNEKNKYVYKSVDPTVHIVIKAVSDFVCQKLACEPIMDAVHRVTTEGYIRNFTPAHILLTDSEIEHYFYVFGIIVSIASFLEITDLHLENLVSTKDGPKIIDAEFMLSHAQGLGAKWSYKRCGLFDGVSSPLGQNHRLSFISPEFFFSEKGVGYRYSRQELRNQHLICTTNGEKIVPSQFAALIQRGAQDADRVIAAHSHQLADLGVSLLPEEHKIRCWVRGTAYYRILQLQLWAPRPPQLSERLTLLRAKLAKKNSLHLQVQPDELKKIIDCEVNDILGQDIPFFWIDGRDGTVNHKSLSWISTRGGCSTANALRRRALETAHRTPSRDFSDILEGVGKPA